MRSDWLRWTVPPGISLLVHAALIGAVAYIGMRISAAKAPGERLPVAELALPAPPNVPENERQDADRDRPQSRPARALPAASAPAPDAVAAQAERLDRSPAASPAMDPVTLEAMRRASARAARPESAAPPSVSFAGVRSRAARTIVYVVDGSGATANSFAYLQTQLMRSIDRLSPTQRFQVVLFRSFDGGGVELAPINGGRLARATPEHKRGVESWLATVGARGRSNPVDGLGVALALRPDLVLLVTRSIQRTEMGWAQGQREILARLDGLNPADPVTGKRPSVIKTIQLLDEDPTGIMRAIGTIHGDGHDDYRVVSYDELARPERSDEDLAVRSIGASDEQRIGAAAELMGSLAASGTSLSVLYSVGDGSQREQAAQTARRVRSLVSGLGAADGRAALLDAQATLLLRCADPGSVGDERLAAIVESLGGVMYTDPDTDAQRILAVAQTMALTGQGEGARERVRSLLTLDEDLGLSDSTRAQALLALVSMGEEPQDLRRRAARAPFVTPGGSIDAVWGLLLREATTRKRLAAGDDDAWSPVLGIREAASADAAISAYIDGRIALLYAAHPGPDEAAVPSPVLLAAADAMSRHRQTRDRALGVLETVAARSDDPTRAAEALWRLGVLGRAIGDDGSIARSNAALTELAQRYPDHPRAREAIASAIGADEGEDEGVRRERLRLAVERYPDAPQIDLWRLELAHLLDGFDRLDVLDPIDPGTREGVLAGELYEQTVLGMLDRYDDPRTRRGLGVRMREAAERYAMSSAALWTKRAALSEAELDPQAALASIDQLISDAKRDHSPTAELELMRAQTLLRLGQTRTAFDALRDLSGRIDATGERTSTYWQAWSLMLETIVARGSAEDRAEALRHIARLRLIDPGLGGPPWSGRISGAEKSLHSSP